MSQTSYTQNHLVAYEGGRGDSRPATIHTGRNNSGSEMPYGRFVCFDAGSGTTELAMKPRSAAGQKNLGVLLWDAAHESQTTGLADDGVGSVLSAGSVWMIAEGTVTPNDKVYVRHTANGSPGTSDGIGRVRANTDGSAQVQTATPTAGEHSKTFVLRVAFLDGAIYEFEYASDGTMTATEVCDGLRVKMAADLAFTARIVATGTSTLIMTAQSVSLDQSVAISAGDGAIVVVNTTPAAPLAEVEPRARFLTSATIGLPVMVELSL